MKCSKCGSSQVTMLFYSYACNHCEPVPGSPPKAEEKTLYRGWIRTSVSREFLLQNPGHKFIVYESKDDALDGYDWFDAFEVTSENPWEPRAYHYLGGYQHSDADDYTRTHTIALA